MAKRVYVKPARVPEDDLAEKRSDFQSPPAVFSAALIGEIIDQELAEVNRIRIEELAAKGRLADMD